MKILKRITCLHEYKQSSSLAFGSFARGIIVCTKCGKKKLIEDLKPWEILL